MRELEGAFGDNDELSSLLATAVKADWLLLLTNVDGFMVPNGRKKPKTAASDPQAHSRARSAMQRQECARARRHDFEAACRETGERRRSSRRDRQWTPSAGDHPGHANARSERISRRMKVRRNDRYHCTGAHPRRKSCCAPVPRPRSWRYFRQKRRIHCCWRLPTLWKRNEKSILAANRRGYRKPPASKARCATACC